MSSSARISVKDCRVVELPRLIRREGNITPVHGGIEVPFEIARVYYLYDVPGGESRGGHAHRELEQLLVSAMGCFEVIVDDGINRERILLNRAYYGLYIPRLIWRELVNFSSGGICLALASLAFREEDYIRDYEAFVKIKQNECPLS